MENLTKIDSGKGPDLLIVPFGGCGEFGMNLTSYIVNNQHFLVDCGIMFPDPRRLGIDAIVPHIGEWISQSKGIGAYFITHGHEDHVGALPFFYKQWQAPIYATAWTVELIKGKFAEHDIRGADIRTVLPGDRITAGDLSVEWIHVNHSIPMACALFIKTKNAKVFHTGDFKYDSDPIGEPPLDHKRIVEIGKSGVDVLLADSTNSTSPGMCPGEKTTITGLKQVIGKSSGTIYVTTFSSNLWRLLIVLEIAKQRKMKVFIAGRGMQKTIDIAGRLNMLGNLRDVIVTEDKVSKVGRKNLIVLLTGCQGEPLSALGRIIRGEHKTLQLRSDDTIIFSSRIIPGSERQVYYFLSECSRLRVNVHTTRSNDKIHVSGHAYQGDLKKLLRAVKPRYYLPVHGTFTQLTANQKLGEQVGIDKKRTLLVEDGSVFRLKGKNLKTLGKVDTNVHYVDAFSKFLLDKSTVKQRLKIGEMGSVFLSATMTKKKGQWQVEPWFRLIGLALPENIDESKWIKDASDAISKAIHSCVKEGFLEENHLSEAARVGLRRFLQPLFGKKVVVVSRVHIV